MNSGAVLFYFLGELILIDKIAKAYDNIALRKNAHLQYPYPGQPWGAEKAVDGRYSDRSAAGGQCTIGANQKRTATWWVNLGSILSIHHITIYYRTDNVAWDERNGYTPRFLGFSVYISNTTNKDEGILCFKDTIYTRATIPNATTLNCVKHGRYVIYYNERLTGVTYPDGYSTYAYNELCELEVYGCPNLGVYGENCNIPCPQNCQEGHCNIVDGTCLGCVVGYKGSRCEEQCDNNRYGLECSKFCGNCSNGEQCNHVNGSCPNGCDTGAQGNKCDEPCPYGRYGKNCVEMCNPNCKGCNRITGVCEFGCYNGWKGTFCQNECDGRMYGQNCSLSCGSCLNFEQCHHINGTCIKGCDRGFQGETCTEACLEGRYGYNCPEPCNINCGVTGKCDRITGQCEGGCQAGWKDMKCDKKCDGGKFGLNCTQSCGVCFEKEQCHYINGTCLNGCDRGYQGINCTQRCSWGSYGYSCNETCSTDCFNRTCDAMSGSCPLSTCSKIKDSHGELEFVQSGCTLCTYVNQRNRKVGTPEPPGTNTAPIIGGVVAAIIVSLAIVAVLILFIRSIRNKACKEQNHQEKSTKHSSSEYTSPNKEMIYDTINDNPGFTQDDNGGYQELGQLSQPSHYDRLR